MNQAELIDRVAASTGLSKQDTTRTLRALVDVINEQVASGDEVQIAKLGKFGSKWRKRSAIRDIQNGRKMLLGGRYVPSFRPSAELRRNVGDRTEQHWRDPEHQRAWRTTETLIGDLELYNEGRPTLPASKDARAIHDACRATFGDDWDRVVQTYETDVPGEVRLAHDYLIETVVARWA